MVGSVTCLFQISPFYFSYVATISSAGQPSMPMPIHAQQASKRRSSVRARLGSCSRASLLTSTSAPTPIPRIHPSIHPRINCHVTSRTSPTHACVRAALPDETCRRPLGSARQPSHDRLAALQRQTTHYTCFAHGRGCFVGVQNTASKGDHGCLPTYLPTLPFVSTSD
ncbi:hypothetical protein BKA81DRAFT_92485 [Phyllosticta paracitricarpa]